MSGTSPIIVKGDNGPAVGSRLVLGEVSRADGVMVLRNTPSVMAVSVLLMCMSISRWRVDRMVGGGVSRDFNSPVGGDTDRPEDRLAQGCAELVIAGHLKVVREDTR